jgi:hypothetical protein
MAAGMARTKAASLSRETHIWPAAAARRARKLGMTVAALLAGGACGAGLYAGSQGVARVLAPAAAPWGAGQVTDGSVPFGTNAEMAAVQDAIAAENRKVTAGGEYVSIALLAPFTYTTTGSVSQARMIDELLGAYLAQMEANLPQNNVGGYGVQLLLANEGTTAEESAGQAVRQIESLETADHIVAVAGMGLSLAATRAAATSLSDDDMPMFGAVTTGDQFNGYVFPDSYEGTTYPGLYQVVPAVDAQVQALSRVLGKQLSTSTVALASDAAATDVYSTNLETDFLATFNSQASLRQYQYTPGAASQFAAIAQGVCSQGSKPPLILYAGRASTLPDLIQRFQQSVQCKDQTVTIVTGSDANGLPYQVTSPKAGPDGAAVTVEFSDIEYHNHSTGDYQADLSDGTSTPCNGCLRRLDSSAAGSQGGDWAVTGARNDEWASATYNSVIAARNAAMRSTATTSAPATPTKSAALANAGGRARTSSTGTGQYKDLPGAAGYLSFTPGGQLTSSTIPIYQDAGGEQPCAVPKPAQGC